MGITFSSPIFGPIQSRRLGVSLGINLLPGDGKVCSFNCIYCECGYNNEHRTHSKLPTRQEVFEALKQKLKEMSSNNLPLDVLTFAGNGEPTSHPDFNAIIDDTLQLRDLYYPAAKVSVLSNSTHINRPSIFEGLTKVDNNILKLDTVDQDYIKLVNQPNNKDFNSSDVVKWLAKFNGECIIQTMFMKGYYNNQSVDNTTDKYVLPWIEALKEIKPKQVMIYTIDRETPCHELQKATPSELQRIADLLRKEGFDVSVSY